MFSVERYLENIYPELLPNNIPQNIIAKPLVFGKKYQVSSTFYREFLLIALKSLLQIRLQNSTFCLTAESAMGRISRGARVEMRVCHAKRTQQWRWNENKDGKLFNQSVGKCIQAVGETTALATLQFCSLASSFVIEEVAVA
ncbi:hypothetical protein ANCDUO_06649 [Ancylostoma duodenale]|uniref:Ricin B lectin domain-containing protein n=1 Tax=Ancylostoma duodenale TaxID=51022 RepID=A0A0C2DKI1_9BILA|nr:hypothetical protein ANCDUO_06649 [Ancylostoma duodenale]